MTPPDRRDASRRRWGAVLDLMRDELGRGEPRLDAYWAQQIAFGPVLVHALLLRIRSSGIAAADVTHLTRIVRLALDLLGALPDGSNGDPPALRILAARQAAALSSGRRSLVRRLALRLGLRVEEACGIVPVRLLRPYPLIGWAPDEVKPTSAEKWLNKREWEDWG